MQIVYFLATDNVALRQIAEGKLRSVVHTNNMIERGRLEGCALLVTTPQPLALQRGMCMQAQALRSPPLLPSLAACVPYRTVPLVSRNQVSHQVAPQCMHYVRTACTHLLYCW